MLAGIAEDGPVKEREASDLESPPKGAQTLKHDPIRFASALNAKLATRSRHVCAFLGAGVSTACGLPNVRRLQELVLQVLQGVDQANFRALLSNRNLEEALSRLRRIASLIDDHQQVDDLTGPDASLLDTRVCEAIVTSLDLGGANLEPVRHLAAWVRRANYHLPIELFTVNYDLLLETALEDLRVPYFDGFVGSLRARFHTELVEGDADKPHEAVPSFFARLWKLHGSVNWAWHNRQIVRLGSAVAGVPAAIYPSDMKYDESRRVPFVVLQDRLRRSLHTPETLVIVSGYSFSDAHLNELLFDAAARCQRSEFAIFCHSSIPAELADRARTTPNLQVAAGKEAILGGTRRPWSVPEDALPHIWRDGSMRLGDFSDLAAYLAMNVAHDYRGDSEHRADRAPST